MQAFNKETTAELERIATADLPELDRLVQAYDWLTSRIIALAEGEIELARAMQDGETMVKQQVKKETLRLARDVFQTCYLRVTGARTRLWEA